MRRHSVSTTVTLCAVASLAAAMGPASAAPVAAPPSVHTEARQPEQPVLVDCLWQPQVHPGDFMIACGDGNSRLSSLRWSQWGPDAALATGINLVNDCKPYCAAGKFHSYPVVVRLDRPEPWKKHPQTQQFTRMNLVYTDDRPEGFEQAVTYPLWS
ncbi:hypothetical protein ABZ468_30880 [Streptomyces sp. NPDC005708]|uniref:hypothetical protein n=1 Tax=Streptomyces sp. NPDC005708 TaxID=3154564 RepID=UPI0033E101A9